MNENLSNQQDHIRIHPDIQRQIDSMRRRKAEARADLHAATAIQAMDRCNRVTAEAIRLREENGRLMGTLHAIQLAGKLPKAPKQVTGKYFMGMLIKESKPRKKKVEA